MACNYDAIREKNRTRFGTEIGRIGKMLLADRYDDRTHFIYELLQNAEDALSKRPNRTGKRSVRFNLKGNSLSVRHFGKPFDENDVEGVCGIDESTKDITSIGRFGIGFKSVYAFTQLPEIHSGDEDFVIENYVWPKQAPYFDREHDETVIVMPGLNSNDCEEIEGGLVRMGPDALVFLKHIEKIEWETRNGSSRVYLRQSESLDDDDNVHRITIVGNTDGAPDAEQVWLVFSKNIYTPDGFSAGHAEIAFPIEDGEICAVPSSPLVVFFPTVVETNLGFRIQGPYRTTPSRDNVPSRDEWNRRCISETASMLPWVLAWLRDHGMLTVNTLQLLPLDQGKFPTSSMFHPFFLETKRCLSEDRLLPDYRGGYIPGNSAVLSRTQEVRELFTEDRLAELVGGDSDIMWLDGGISQDRTPELRKYLREALRVKEYDPRTILSMLNASFLRRQSDEWLRQLYEFLVDQPSLRRQATDLLLIRLDDGMHTKPYDEGEKPAAFLPGEAETGFPTVRRSTCDSEKARDFLRGLGLTEPDAVDDIVANVLPKYADPDFNILGDEYKRDMRRIMEAFKTGSDTQQKAITEMLREYRFVRCMDAGDNTISYAPPEKIYFPTERLKQLFSGVRGIKLSDDGDEIFRTDSWRSLLEACGVVRYLRPVQVYDVNRLSNDQRKDLRDSINWEDQSYRSERIEDWDLLGVHELIELLPNLDCDDRASRSRFLWEELANLLDRRGRHVYNCTYSWFYHKKWSVSQDSAFVRLLNSAKWVPDPSGNLHEPGALDFESLGWKADPFLQSKIKFIYPVVEQLAQEAGFDPELLRRLKKGGITSVADFEKLLPPERSPTPSTPEGVEHKRESTGARLDDYGDDVDSDSGNYGRYSEGRTGDDQVYSRDSRRSASHRFVSYIDVRHEESGDDPDRLNHEDRMELEGQAIEFILSIEPQWTTTPASNPGFDLFEEGSDGKPARWCEVKAMTGTLDDRPVTLSRTQFECARQKGQDYYLYVVELAGTPGSRRLVRIQNPVGEARYFTFDRGWRDIADSDHE